MFQFGTSEQNSQIPIFTGVMPQYQIYNPVQQFQHHKTLQTLKVQTDYLVTEMNGIKEVLGDFISQVRTQLGNLTQNITALQRTSQSEKPRKKFRKIINCPIEECGRRYSSKIALNCHIRTKHGSKKE